MPKHIETLLTSAGLPAEDVTTIVNLPEADQETFDVNPYVEKVRTNYKTQLQNDPDFFNELTLEKLPASIKKQVENGQFGRASKIVLDKFIKGIGMTEADYADLPQETKDKIELLIPAIAEKWTKTKAGDKQVQADLIEARKKLEEYDGYEEKIKGQYETEANQKINAGIFKAILISELSAIPGLKIKAAHIAKAAEDILTSKYAFERVGDFGIELRQKGNPQMKVLKDNSSHELTLKEVIQSISIEEGWAGEENVDEKGSGKFKVETKKDGTLHMAPHVRDKISNKIKSEA